MDVLRRLNPAVPRAVLPAVAGLVWAGVAAILLVRAGGWFLHAAPGLPLWLALVVGLVMAALLIPLMFLRIVRRNLARIATRPERTCLFSVFAWRSWILVAVMTFGGVTLRHSAAPRLVLAAPYLGMGLCLLAGAILYLRALGR